MVTDYEKSVESMWKDMRELRTDLRGVMAALRDKASERASHVRENISQAADHRLEQLRHVGERISDKSRLAVEKTQETVRKRPIVSILAAAGIGALIGGLLLRKRQ